MANKKLNLYTMRSYKTIACWLWLAFLCPSAVPAQNEVISTYFEQAGEYAGLFNGEIEANYYSIVYKNQPYYKDSGFSKGNLVFKNIAYDDIGMRFDLHKDQLVVVSPKGFNIVPDSKEIEKFYLHGKTFVRKTNADTKEIKEGFYILLHDGKTLKLFCKESVSLTYADFAYHFKPQSNYFVFYNNHYYPVKDQKSLTKLFPQLKKQIEKYTKENKLNFKKNTAQSLVLTVNYCEGLHI